MIKKVIKIGSSLGVTLSSDHLRKLALSKGSVVEVVFNKKRGLLEISPVTQTTDEGQHFLSAFERLAQTHKTELEQLDNEW